MLLSLFCAAKLGTFYLPCKFSPKKVSKNLAETYQGSGFHTVDEAIRNAYEGSDRTPLQIEDYVFTVTDLKSGVSERYRVNAGNHVKLIPEE